MGIPDWLKTRLAAVFAIDLRSLALFRVMLGSVLFIDLARRLTDLRVFYTDLGVMPRDWLVQVNGLWRISLHTANGETWFVATLFIIEMIAALLIAFGWRTRLATILAFVLHASLLNRNPLVLLGGDILILMLIFWGMFLPLAARASVDAALAQTPPPSDNRHLSWASAGLLLQVMSVYFFSAILKNGRDWWPDGTAVDYALQIDGYATPIGVWLRGFPELTHPLTYYVYFLEMLGPILVFSPVFNRPLRFLVMVLLMAMHTGFLFCLALGPFPWISLTALTTLIGGWLWDAGARRSEQRSAQRIGPQPLRLYYDRDCGFCLKSVLILKRLLLLPRAEIAPAQDTPRAKTLLEANYSWVVIDHDDKAWLKWPAFVILLRRSPLFAPLGRLLSGRWAVRPGNAVYDFVGRHRGRFATASGKLLPFHDRPFETGDAAQAVAGFLMIVLLIWNFCTVRWLPNSLYAMLTPPLRELRIDQYWDMFAPFPSREDGWFVFPAQLLDGTELDLLHPERGAVRYEKPEYISQEWPNIRWHKYLERIWSVEFSANRTNYSRYLCRSWNAAHTGGRQLNTFKMIYMLEMSVPPPQVPKVEQTVIWRWDCFGKPTPAP
ncbi:MAG: hypothetical protein NVS9B10_12750 [Nevskia sp.]